VDFVHYILVSGTIPVSLVITVVLRCCLKKHTF